MNSRSAGVPIVVLTDAASKESRAVNGLHVQTFIANPFGDAVGTLITFASGDTVIVAEDFDTERMPKRAAISCSPIRSKSSGTLISPFRNPSRRGTAGASIADTFTRGSPAFGDDERFTLRRMFDQP